MCFNLDHPGIPNQGISLQYREPFGETRVAAGQGQGPRVRAGMSLEGRVRAQMFGPQVRAGPNFEARP